MRIVVDRFLAVLDAIESFLLDSGDELAVYEQRSRRLVIHAIDTKNDHRATSMQNPLQRASVGNQSIGPLFPPDASKWAASAFRFAAEIGTG
jgi:hypothetical protein